MKKMLTYEVSGPGLPGGLETVRGNMYSSCENGVTVDWVENCKKTIAGALNYDRPNAVIILSIVDMEGDPHGNE